MSLKIKEPLRLSDSSALTNNLHLNIKEEPFEPESFLLTHNMPLKQLEGSFLTNNIPLYIKEETLEHCQSFPLSDNQPLYIKVEYLEEPQNCSLTTNALSNIKEKPLELSDRSSVPVSLSIKDDVSKMADGSLNNSMDFNAKEPPIQPIDDSIVMNKTCVKEQQLVLPHSLSLQNNVPFNIKKEITVLPITENDYVPLKMEIEKKSESCDPSFSVAAASEKNNIINEEISNKKAYMSEKNILNSRDTPAFHSISSVINANCNGPVLANNSDCLIVLGSKNSLTGHKNIAQSNVNAAPNSYVSLPLLTPLHDVTPSYIQDASIKNNTKSFLLINNLYNSQYPSNSPIILQASNPEKNINDTIDKPKVIKRKNVWEIRRKDTVLRGIDNESLKLHLSNTSDKSLFVKKTASLRTLSIINREPLIQRKLVIPKPIIHSEPKINSNTPHCLSDKNSPIKPAFVKAGKIWEIRDGKNVMRGVNKESLENFFPTDLNTVSSQDNMFLVENTGIDINVKNCSELKKKQDEGKSNARNLLQSLEFDGVHDPICLVKDTKKCVDQGISNVVGESTELESLKEARKENASQFQCESNKRKPHPRSILRSSHAAQESTFLAKSVGKLINIQNSHETQVDISNEFQNKQCKGNYPFHVANEFGFLPENMEKPMNKNIAIEASKSIAGNRRGALVYDRISTGSQKSALTKLLEPLYKYLKDNKCLLCGFESKSTDTYGIRKHLICHLPGKYFKCDACGKCFSSPDGLAGHKANMHSKGKAEVSCKECNKKFSSSSALNCHRRSHHKPAVCLICNREYKNSSDLKQHYRIHTGEKPYACVICSKSFRTRDMLNSHSFKHKAEKLYSCPECDKSYNRKGLLNEHRNSHKRTSDIKCRICKKTFNYTSNLHQHMFVHLDKRPHKCETCGLKFKLAHHLKSHVSTHH